MIILILIVIFLAIMLIGTPVGFAMGALTYTSFFALDGDLALIPHKLFTAINSYTYVCLLLYIFSRYLMSVLVLSKEFVRFCTIVVLNFNGGLALLFVLGSLLF